MPKQVLRLRFEVLENMVSEYKSKHRRYRSSPPSLPSSANFVNSLTLRICSLPSGDFKFSTFDLKKSAWLARRESSGIPSLYLRNKVSKSYRSGKKGLHLSSEQATCKRRECSSSETVLLVQVAIVDVNLLKKWYRRRYILVFLLWTFTVEHAMHKSLWGCVAEWVRTWRLTGVCIVRQWEQSNWASWQCLQCGIVICVKIRWNIKHTVCFLDLTGTPLRGCPVKRLYVDVTR